MKTRITVIVEGDDVDQKVLMLSRVLDFVNKSGYFISDGTVKNNCSFTVEGCMWTSVLLLTEKNPSPS